MSKLRTFLELNGVSPADLSAAVADARDVVKLVGRWSSVGAHALQHAAKSERLGKKARVAVVMGAVVLSKVEQGAAEMLERKFRK